MNICLKLHVLVCRKVFWFFFFPTLVVCLFLLFKLASLLWAVSVFWAFC